MMKYILVLAFINLIACSNSPRYRTGSAKSVASKSKSPAPLKTKSKVKYRKMMKGACPLYTFDAADDPLCVDHDERTTLTKKQPMIDHHNN